MRFVKRHNLLNFVHHTVVSYPAPATFNYWWNMGSLALFCLVTQIITGIFLAMHYIPSAEEAFNSVEHIMRDVNYGWLIRYIHANGASMFFLVVYLHIFRGLFYGSYYHPRELLWVVGVVILLIMILTAFMGYVLPWGQMSFWAATVITTLVSAIPYIGQNIVYWLWGGFSVDHATLNRFFSLHYLFPFVLLGLVILHVLLLHETKSNNPNVSIISLDHIPMSPYYTIKDVFGVVIFLMIFSYFVFFMPNYLGHPDNYIEANPMVTPTHIVPEWYFLPFYAILRSVPNKLGGVLLLLGAIAILIILPFYARGEVRDLNHKPIEYYCFSFFVSTCLLLGWIGGKSIETPYLEIGRGVTIYYFVYLLIILPIVIDLEKSLHLPNLSNSSLKKLVIFRYKYFKITLNRYVRKNKVLNKIGSKISKYFQDEKLNSNVTNIINETVLSNKEYDIVPFYIKPNDQHTRVMIKIPVNKTSYTVPLKSILLSPEKVLTIIKK